MKKLLIVNNNMHIGGVQRALVSLLWNLRERYEVTLLLFYAGGECLSELPPDVRVVAAESAYRYIGMTRADAGKRFTDRFWRAFFAGITRLFGREAALRLMAIGQPVLSGYDVAISYLHDAGEKLFYGGCNAFVLRHVEATRKVAFLHCDYRLCGADTAANRRQYAAFDTIAACSEGCAASFVTVNPSLAERVRVVKNCQRYEAVRQAAEQAPVTLDDSCLNVVTVARLGREKGVSRAIDAITRLRDVGDRLHYYVVGDGVERESIRQKIAENGLSDRVTLCGELPNPYGYIVAADLLLIPSVSEAAPLVIGEATCLGTPVLSTATSSAEEMVAKSGFGWVCDNSIDGLVTELSALLDDPALLKEKAAGLAAAVFDDHEAVEAFHRAVVCGE